jgi:hypothetical protein
MTVVPDDIDEMLNRMHLDDLVKRCHTGLSEEEAAEVIRLFRLLHAENEAPVASRILCGRRRAGKSSEWLQ